MASHWLLKTEPSSYSFADLERDRHAVWDGVRNPVALRHLRTMQAGDEVFVYHTGDEKAIVGIARVTRGAYPDPKAKDDRLVVVDLEPLRRVDPPVPLSAVKRDPSFATFPLVRISRLSVMPVTDAEWARLLRLSGK